MKTVSKLLMAVIILLPLAYLAAIYNKLPQIVPIHYGLNGKPDDFGDKSSLIWLNLLLVVVNAGAYLLLTNLHKINPKRNGGKPGDSIGKIAVGVVVLLTGLNLMIMYATLNQGFAVDKFILPFIGLFFAFLGNLMFSIKPNYFAGVRTPWTLNDEDNWRKTHQLAGKLWFAGGIVIIICTSILPPPYSFFSLVAITLIISIIPVMFSYNYFKKHKKSNNSIN